MRPGLFVVLVRLACRNALRRKGEALLVVLGSLLGTAIITSSFVVGDTLHATIRDQASTRLGPIDEIALVHDLSLLDPALQRITATPLPDTDGVLSEATASVAVATEVDSSGRKLAEPDAFIQEVDFDAGRAFGGNAADTGLADAGPTPTGEEAVLGADLADSLHVGPGSRIGVSAYGQTRAFTVRNVVPRLGLAGFHPGFASRAQNVFVAPGTLAAMAATAPPGAVLPEGRVLVSNEGGVFDSTAPSDAVILEMQIRTAGLGPIEFTDEKQQTLEFADRQGDNFARLFGLIGSFTVVAGVLLLINIFVMLAEERKSELGTLRALGFTRRHLVRVFGLEGTAYSVAAAALGALAGIGVGRVVVRATEGIFSQGERGIVGLKFAVTPASLFTGFAIGLAIALITVWGTSVRISRLNIIRAIRDTPEPPHQAKPGDLRRDAAGVVLGAAIFVVGVGWQQPVAALLGPSLMALCLAPLLMTRVLAAAGDLAAVPLAARLCRARVHAVAVGVQRQRHSGLLRAGTRARAVRRRLGRGQRRPVPLAQQTAVRCGRRGRDPPWSRQPAGEALPHRAAARDVRAHRVRPRVHGRVRRCVPGTGATHHRRHDRGLRHASRQQPRQSRRTRCSSKQKTGWSRPHRWCGRKRSSRPAPTPTSSRNG